MKEQGLRQTQFNSISDIQNSIMESPIHTEDSSSGVNAKDYLYKAYETFTMLQSASQVDENSSVKNEEIVRMQSYSRSMLDRILALNRLITR